MAQLISDFETFYDSKQKIWSGPKYESYYDRNCSFGRIAFEELRRRGKKVCQISDSENTILTNEEARIQGIRIAKKFESFGIKQSDIIGLAGRNTTYVLGVTLACFFHGSAYHAINPNYDKKTSKHLFDITQPKIIFCDGEDLEKIKFASMDFETKIYTLSNHAKGTPTVLDLLESTGDEHFYKPAKLEYGFKQNLAILCSSGSTGLPKAVTIPHCFRSYICLHFLTQDDVQFMGSTMDWMTAFVSVTNSIIYGAARIISNKLYTPEYFLELVQKYKITTVIQSPPQMAALVKSPAISAEIFNSMRYYFCGGSSCSLASKQLMQSYLRNGRIMEAYGFTEINNCLTTNTNFTAKPKASGKLLPGFKARIVNAKGENVGPGEAGEIWCRHDEFWAGYYRNKEATNLMCDDEGWFHSGDLGYFDEDNYLYVIERIKELLKYKGIQYFPSEIEEVILEMPNVKEVCVFGIESDTEGDCAAAAVIPVEESALTPEDVINYIRQSIDAEYKQLHAGCMIFKELPKTGSSKNNRKKTKEQFVENQRKQLKC